MRRAMLVIVGFSAGGMMLIMLFAVAREQYGTAQAKGTDGRMTGYPMPVMNTELVAIQTAEYEGPFWEDGSDEEVVGIAALVVENTGGVIVSQGTVILEWGNERMVFELSQLPPGRRVLVLEKNRRRFITEEPTACYGWSRGEYPEDPGTVTVEVQGMGTMILTNQTDGDIGGVTVNYKHYDSGSDMFIGGISYSIYAEALKPREMRLMKPAHFAAVGSKVVSVLQEPVK